MLKRVSGVFIAIMLALFCTACAKAAPAETPRQGLDVNGEEYQLEQVLVLSRHNIRSPLSTNGSVLSEMTNHEWFDWTSKASELSLRGGDLEVGMGQYFRKYLAAKGLLEENCVPEGDVVRVYANSMQRTIATANYFATGMFPVANVDVEHHEEIGTMDPVFFPRLTFVNDAYLQAVEQQKNELVDLESLQDNFALLEEVLDYDESAYAQKLPSLDAPDARYIFEANEEPNMEGSLKVANTASDALKLQYFEEPDPKKAAFGHDVSLAEWEKIGEIADVYSQMLFGLPLLATNVAHPLLQEMRAELQNGDRVFTFLCGHDSNIESVLAALDVKEYDLPGVLEKKTPIGGMVVIERWKSLSDGKDYISATFVYQTLDQLRERPLLDIGNPPASFQLEFEDLAPNGDGLYSAEDVIGRFDAAIQAYDDMVARYE